MVSLLVLRRVTGGLGAALRGIGQGEFSKGDINCIKTDERC